MIFFEKIKYLQKKFDVEKALPPQITPHLYKYKGHMI